MKRRLLLNAKRGGTLGIAALLLIATVWLYSVVNVVEAQRPTRTPSVAPSQESVANQELKIMNQDDPFPECQKAVQQNRLYKEVLDVLVPWTLEKKSDEQLADRKKRESLVNSIYLVRDCFSNLNQNEELADYYEKMAALYPDNWRILSTVGLLFDGQTHSGALIDNVFRRGYNDGSARFVSSEKRDRARALQILTKAYELAEAKYATLDGVENGEAENGEAGQIGRFYRDFARIFQRGSSFQRGSIWGMQKLTDYSTLPDYEDFSWGDGIGGGYAPSSLPPVDENGDPIFYFAPKTFAEAKSDGERWRFLYERACAVSPLGKTNYLRELADFAQSNFGVQTLQDYNYFFRDDQTLNDDPDATDGVWSLHTLEDDETIARLATGIKRFKLPKEYSPIALYREIVALQPDPIRRAEYQRTIIDEYINRRQYAKAVAGFEEIFAGYDEYFSNQTNPRQNRQVQDVEKYEQIVNNWGRFEPTQSKASGTDVSLSYLFRNGSSASFVAYEVKVPELLNDVKKIFVDASKAPGGRNNVRTLQPEELGHRLVQDDATREKYLGNLVAKWDVSLDPLPGHYDKRTNVALPFDRSGTFLIEATMKDGNRDSILVWLNDSTIVCKQIDGASYYFVADAKTGEPVPNARLDFFGYRIDWEAQGNKQTVRTKERTEQTDESGQFVFKPQDPDYLWRVVATTSPDSAATGERGRFAFLNFNHFWANDRYDEEYNQVRAYFVSDRPVYRPNQKAEFKFWVGTSKYDLPNECEWAGKKVRLQISDPVGETILDKDVELDDFGGFADSFDFAKDAKLGPYNFVVLRKKDGDWLGSGSVRLEEYKKPEFEVSVDAPKEPVKLGDSFKIKINAQYYFGAPVQNATVKYKVERQKHSVEWFPVRPWDWFYGNGYSWFAYDYFWYPGWAKWGCRRPSPFWIYRNDYTQSEIVAQQEVPIGEDGTVEVEIDSSLAKTIFPDDDQRYSITAEVVDQSRRTIVGNGSVLVAKEPFKVYAWVDRGFYETDQQIQASFQTRRIDGKPVPGNATVKVYQIAYQPVDDSEKNVSPSDWQANGVALKPIETEVHSESLKIGDDGIVRLSLAGRAPGQYRLSCVVDDGKGGDVEGGYVFSVRGKNSSDSANVSPSDATTPKAFQFNELELIPDKAEYAPGETVRLQINTKQPDSTVLFFLRSSNETAGTPEVLRLNDSTRTVEIPVVQKDMPNFFVEALTVSNGRVYSEAKEIVVPPAKRILNVDVSPTQDDYRPGEKAKATIRITDMNGEPVVGQTVVSVYDKSLDYISGGSNTEDVKEFFWKWRRSINPQVQHNLERIFGNVTPQNEKSMQNLGMFGYFSLREEDLKADSDGRNMQRQNAMGGGRMGAAAAPMGGMGGGMARLSTKRSAFGENSMAMEAAPMPDAAPMMMMAAPMMKESVAFARDDDSSLSEELETKSELGLDNGALVEATIRKNFADTAFWVADLTTDENGTVDVEFDMPENLTTWKIGVWSMGLGTKVGEGNAEVITRKDLIIRMQKPRFLVQKDRVTLSANVHNYLSEEKDVQVSLEFPNDSASGANDVSAANANADSAETASKATVAGTDEKANDANDATDETPVESPLTLLSDDAVRTIRVPANGEARVDWEVRADRVGTASLLMKALTNEESDAIQDSLTVFVHGMTKQDAISGMIEPILDSKNASEVASKTNDNSSSVAANDDSNGKLAFSGSATFEMTVPEERRPEQTKLTVRFSPTLAGAAIDALPYLTSYPYGCTEQTLNRFLPTVLTQKVLLDAGINLEDLAKKRANLNAQELGSPEERSAQWQKSLKTNRRSGENVDPVFDLNEVRNMTEQGVQKLTEMQCSDGGWGWFSGWGEHSSPHLTALVLHGLLTARRCDADVDPNAIERGKNWLLEYQKGQALQLINGRLWTQEEKSQKQNWREYKNAADHMDAFVYFVLTEAGVRSDESFVLGNAVKKVNLPDDYLAEMKDSTEEFPLDDETRARLGALKSRWSDESSESVASVTKEFLWDSRADLSLYALSNFGLALNEESLSASAKVRSANSERVEMILRTLSQYLQQDDENQTAWLDLKSGRNWFWWAWFDGEFETQAYYLKLLVAVNPNDPVAPRLVKYLLNNRKNATYWNSTRDTALCVEAFADYIRQTDEFHPQTTVEILVDGEVRKSVEVTPENLFFIDNTLELSGEEVASGTRKIEIRQTGTGPIYYNAYLENFTLEDPIEKTGLEVKVERRFYRLDDDETATTDVAGDRGQVYSQRIEKKKRTPLESFAEVKSGDLVEIELIVESKNDYESILIEDMKAAGLEATDLRSGYNGNPLGAYVEFRDERVCFFVSRLPQGEHSITYRLRAEQPGEFSALPTKIWGMYAPELKGNSDEFKVNVVDNVPNAGK